MSAATTNQCIRPTAERKAQILRELASDLVAGLMDPVLVAHALDNMADELEAEGTRTSWR